MNVNTKIGIVLVLIGLVCFAGAVACFRAYREEWVLITAPIFEAPNDIHYKIELPDGFYGTEEMQRRIAGSGNHIKMPEGSRYYVRRKDLHRVKPWQFGGESHR
jgi:hypothetical protein